MGGGRVAPSIPDPSPPVTCPGVRTHRRSTPRWCRASAGGPPPEIRRPPRTTGARPAAGADPRKMRRPATDGPRLRVSPRLVMAPAHRRGSRLPVLAGRRHPPITGVGGHPGRHPAATAGRVHPGSRHLAGPAARVRRRAGTDRPVRRATAPAATHAPPPQATRPVTRGPLRRARPHPVRDGERTPARAGGVTRRPRRADRTIVGRMRADVMRVADASPAPRRVGGLRHPVRSPAARVTFTLTAVPGLRRAASTSAAPTSWTRGRRMLGGTTTPEAGAGGVACSAGAAAGPT